MKAPSVVTVTQLNTYLKSVFDGDSNLTNIYLSGEISNFTNHYRSGHLYFSLKDEKCSVRAVMFSSSARRIRFTPQDGMKVLVRGRVSVYEASGQYQVYVDDMQPDGVGALNLAFEQLKRKLAAEGLFDASRKKPLPRYPARIGVATSPTGAAVRDILQILGRRWPAAEIIFCPVLVQGDGAAQQIAEAVRRFNRLRCADVLIVGRGGGSAEDLWAFNEEIVARAVAESEIPVISAVGHETDFTICDFAADLRAPTPSAAAELAVPDCAEIAAAAVSGRLRARAAVDARLRTEKTRLQAVRSRRVMANPQELVSLRRIKTDALSARLDHTAGKRLDGEKSRLAAVCAKLDALSPMRVLARGYSITTLADGGTLSRIDQVKAGDTVKIRMLDGEIGASVTTLEHIPERAGKIE